jgi:hypothetical protein
LKGRGFDFSFFPWPTNSFAITDAAISISSPSLAFGVWPLLRPVRGARPDRIVGESGCCSVETADRHETIHRMMGERGQMQKWFGNIGGQACKPDFVQRKKF